MNETINELKELVTIFKKVQKTRMAFENAKAQHEYKRIVELYTLLTEVFDGTEKETQKLMKKTLKKIPIYTEFLQHVKGMGHTLSAQLIAYIGDIKRFPTVAKLWRYAGLGVDENGKADGRQKGKPLKYKQDFKSLMYNIGVSFLKSKSPYTKFYNKAKAKYQQTRPDWTKAHIHMASLRYMNKIFLSHVFNAWYRLENEPMRLPYVVEYLNHSTIIMPEDVIPNLKLPEPKWLTTEKV